MKYVNEWIAGLDKSKCWSSCSFYIKRHVGIVRFFSFIVHRRKKIFFQRDSSLEIIILQVLHSKPLWFWSYNLAKWVYEKCIRWVWLWFCNVLQMIKVARVVNLKLVFTDWFLYNLVILIKYCKIRYLN